MLKAVVVLGSTVRITLGYHYQCKSVIHNPVIPIQSLTWANYYTWKTQGTIKIVNQRKWTVFIFSGRFSCSWMFEWYIFDHFGTIYQHMIQHVFWQAVPDLGDLASKPISQPKSVWDVWGELYIYLTKITKHIPNSHPPFQILAGFVPRSPCCKWSNRWQCQDNGRAR